MTDLSVCGDNCLAFVKKFLNVLTYFMLLKASIYQPWNKLLGRYRFA